MANDRDPNFAEARPIEVNEPVPGRASTPVHVSYGPDRRPSGLGTFLAAGALAFLLGGAGAWAYLNYLDPIVGKQRSEARQAKGQESQAGSPAPELSARVDSLSGKLDQLQTDVERIANDDINRWTKGWGGYFRHGYPRQCFRDLNRFLQLRTARHLRRRSQRAYRTPAGESFYAHLQRLGLRLL